MNLILCLAFRVAYLVRVQRLKLDTGVSHGCDLNTSQENEWTLVDIFALLMLFSLFVPATEALCGTFIIETALRTCADLEV